MTRRAGSWQWIYKWSKQRDAEKRERNSYFQAICHYPWPRFMLVTVLTYIRLPPLHQMCMHECVYVCLILFRELLGMAALFCFSSAKIIIDTCGGGEDMKGSISVATSNMKVSLILPARVSLPSLLGGPCLHFPEDTGLCSINVHVTIFSTHLLSALDMCWSLNSTSYHSSLVHPDNWTDDQAKCLILIFFFFWCAILNSTDISFKECFWMHASLTNPKRLLMSLMTQRKTKGSLVRLTESFGSYTCLWS